MSTIISGVKTKKNHPGSTVFSGVPKTSAVPLTTSVPHHDGNSISGNVKTFTSEHHDRNETKKTKIVPIARPISRPAERT